MLRHFVGKSMFRLLRLKPPNGWDAVGWELAIVTIGVMLALAAQEWVEDRSWRGRVEATKSALRNEVAEHYGYAVEFRVVYPCLHAQLERLRARVLSTEGTLDPAPVFKETDLEYVVRMPTKFYPTDAWEEAIGDGVVQRFEAPIRRLLAGHYAALPSVSNLNAANTEAELELMALAHPLPVDPAVKYAIIGQLEKLRGRLRYLDLTNGQLIDFIQQLGMVPPAEDARALTLRYGTYRFCKAQRLPMRSMHDAMRAVPN